MTDPTCGATIKHDARTLVCVKPPDHLGPVHTDADGLSWNAPDNPQPGAEPLLADTEGDLPKAESA
jgi:hypothetical protein